MRHLVNLIDSRAITHRARPSNYHARPSKRRGRPFKHRARPFNYRARPSNYRARPSNYRAWVFALVVGDAASGEPRRPDRLTRHHFYLTQTVFSVVCRSQLPHKSVNLSSTITSKKDKVDGFVRELTFALAVGDAAPGEPGRPDRFARHHARHPRTPPRLSPYA